MPCTFDTLIIRNLNEASGLGIDVQDLERAFLQ
jgi:hypothetical protein